MNKWMEETKNDMLTTMEREVEFSTVVRLQMEGLLVGTMQKLSAGEVTAETEKAFWSDFGKIVQESGLYELYQLYNTLNVFYTEAENQFNCFPLGLTEKERITAMGQVEVMAPQNDAAERFMTIYMPVDWEELNAYLRTRGVERWEALEVCSIHSEWCQEPLDFLTEDQMPNLYEANRFFERYAELSAEQRRMLEYMVDIHQPRTLRETTDLTGKMDSLCLVNGISTHKQLGEFLVENEMTDVEFSDEVLPYLDYDYIGKKHMELHHGVMWGNKYAEDVAYEYKEQETAKEAEQETAQPVEQEAENDLTM